MPASRRGLSTSGRSLSWRTAGGGLGRAALACTFGVAADCADPSPVCEMNLATSARSIARGLRTAHVINDALLSRNARTLDVRMSKRVAHWRLDVTLISST